MKDSSYTIAQIFDLLRDGKTEEGVTLLYNVYYNKLFGIAFTFVKNEDASQDIVHNVIYKLLTLDIEKFPHTNELSWLYTVVKNQSYDYLRKNRNDVDFDNIAFLIKEDKDINDFVDMEKYYTMLKGLNDSQKTVVTLKVLGGYTHKEIAQMIGKPIGTVQWLYNMSIKKLKITLSTLFIGIIVSFTGIAASLMSFAGIFGGGADSNLPVGDSQERIQSLTWLIAFAIIFIVFLFSFILIYKNSYKIPTKAEKKSV